MRNAFKIFVGISELRTHLKKEARHKLEDDIKMHQKRILRT
jgi:hypothetical protein